MERKQRKSLNPEKISTINRLMLTNQSTKFIAETLDTSTSTMIKEYVGEVIRKMNEDPEMVYERYFEKMREYLSMAFNGDYF